MSEEFEKRLEKAIERGSRMSDVRQQEQVRAAMNEDELKRLHSTYRLALSEHIESCMKKLPDHFPGFQFETVVGDRGWGASVNRDDIGRPDANGRRTYFSRLEVTIRPFSGLHVLELAAKGTIRNKEIYNRTHFQRLQEADTQMFTEMIDLWTLEYAELYAAKK